MRPCRKCADQHQNQYHENNRTHAHQNERLVGTRLNVFPSAFDVPPEAPDGGAARGQDEYARAEQKTEDELGLADLLINFHRIS